MESNNYIVIDMQNGNWAVGCRSIHPGVDYGLYMVGGSFGYMRKLANDLNAQTAHPPKGRIAKVAALLFALFLALGTSGQDNIILEVKPVPKMAGSATMLDGRVYQIQEITYYTNKFVIEGGETNLFKTVQGPTLTNWCERVYVRTDKPPDSDSAPILPNPLVPPQPPRLR